MDDGAQLQISCKATLSEIRPLKWAREMAESSLAINFRKNTLIQDVVISNGQDEIMPEEDFEAHMGRLLERLYLTLDPAEPLESGKNYRFALEVTLKRRDLPSWMQVPFLFKSWDIVPGDRAEREFQAP